MVIGLSNKSKLSLRGKTMFWILFMILLFRIKIVLKSRCVIESNLKHISGAINLNRE